MDCGFVAVETESVAVAHTSSPGIFYAEIDCVSEATCYDGEQMHGVDSDVLAAETSATLGVGTTATCSSYTIAIHTDNFSMLFTRGLHGPVFSARPGPLPFQEDQAQPSPARPVSSWARPGPLPSWQKKRTVLKTTKKHRIKHTLVFPR